MFPVGRRFAGDDRSFATANSADVVLLTLAFATIATTTIDTATFSGPAAVRCHPSGQVLVVDDLDHRLSVFARSGERVRVLGGHGSGPGQLLFPDAVHWDTHGLLYIADTGANRVQVWRENGEFVRELGRTTTGCKVWRPATVAAAAACLGSSAWLAVGRRRRQPPTSGARHQTHPKRQESQRDDGAYRHSRRTALGGASMGVAADILHRLSFAQ